jgi:hypothetical protein
MLRINPKGKDVLTTATYNLMYNVLLGNFSGLSAFVKRTKGKRAEEIARHLANFRWLTFLYERTPDGQTSAICDALAVEEDWIAARLGF